MKLDARAGRTILGCAVASLLMASIAIGRDDLELGPLMLDPMGADFTAWINRFKDQMYQHWPPADLPVGAHGWVLMEFSVARDGSLRRVRVKQSSGERALRKAAEDALRASTLPPLPKDYKRESITVRLELRVTGKPTALLDNRIDLRSAAAPPFLTATPRPVSSGP